MVKAMSFEGFIKIAEKLTKEQFNSLDSLHKDKIVKRYKLYVGRVKELKEEQNED